MLFIYISLACNVMVVACLACHASSTKTKTKKPHYEIRKFDVEHGNEIQNSGRGLREKNSFLRACEVLKKIFRKNSFVKFFR